MENTTAHVSEESTSDDSIVSMEDELDQHGNTFRYRLMTTKSSSKSALSMVKTVSSKVLQTILLVCVAVILVLQIATLSYMTTSQSCPSVTTDSSAIQLSQQDRECNEILDNNTQLVKEVTEQSAEKLQLIAQTLSNLEGSLLSTKGAVDDILLVTEELLNLQNKSSIITSKLPVSCQEILATDPESPSGYYQVNNHLVYCKMDELCTPGRSGWTRLGYLDMNDLSGHCPSEFTLTESDGIRGCGRYTYSQSGCVSVAFSSFGIQYSEICGRVIGYQKGTPDAVDTRFTPPYTRNNIDSYYVDGISITHGFPRQHIWTLMAGVHDTFYDDGNCPCNAPPGSTQHVQDFVGNDYFCESGNPLKTRHSVVYATDPLWDGSGCGTQEQDCCSASGLPWFHKIINSTSDSIELRECGDEPAYTEDVLVNFYEIYVR